MWMAPNLVTTLGLLILGGSYWWMLFYDMTMTERLPEWTYLFVAFGIFAFQTLDAIDGKQARRTGSSSPLGQLFDHGCDAISWTIWNMAVVSFLQLGFSLTAILTISAAIAPFFFTNLLEHYSGVFVYSVGYLDGTTAQVMLILFNLLPGFLGNGFYDYKASEYLKFLPGIMTEGFVFRDYCLVIAAYMGVIYSVILIFKLFKWAESFGTYVQITLQIIQHLLCYVLMYMFNDKIPFIHNWTGFAYMSILLLYCLITTKLIVCIMSKMYFSFLHWEYLVFLPFFYIQSQYDGTVQSEETIKWAFIATFVAMFLLYARFVQSCIGQLTEYLNVSCFTIDKKEKIS